MTALSITLPPKLAAESKKFAHQMGLSRSEFIRIAIKHEIAHLEKQMQQNEMRKSFKAMQKDPAYLAESEQLEAGFSENIAEDEDEWWQ